MPVFTDYGYEPANSDADPHRPATAGRSLMVRHVPVQAWPPTPPDHRRHRSNCKSHRLLTGDVNRAVAAAFEARADDDAIHQRSWTPSLTRLREDT